VPLEPDTVAAIDAWIAERAQRALPHPRDGRPAEVVFPRARPSPHLVPPPQGPARCGRGRQPGWPRRPVAADRPAPAETHLPNQPDQRRRDRAARSAGKWVTSPRDDTAPRKASLATIRGAYQSAMDKVRAGQLLPLTVVGGAPTVPDKVQWLHAEMLKTRLPRGFCARAQAAGPCLYATSASGATSSSPTPRRKR
jgi:hypothetical protein